VSVCGQDAAPKHLPWPSTQTFLHVKQFTGMIITDGALAQRRARFPIVVFEPTMDAAGIPMTVFFDGSRSSSGRPTAASSAMVEVLYSWKGQTADQMIERVVHLLGCYGEVFAVMGDHAERDTAISFGRSAASCDGFIQGVESALGELGDEIGYYNRRERHRFQGPRQAVVPR